MSTAQPPVQTRDGRTFEKLILHRRGSPEHPLKPDEIEYKFRKVVSANLPKGDAERMVKLVMTLEALDDLSGLVSSAAAPGAANPG